MPSNPKPLSCRSRGSRHASGPDRAPWGGCPVDLGLIRAILNPIVSRDEDAFLRKLFLVRLLDGGATLKPATRDV